MGVLHVGLRDRLRGAQVHGDLQIWDRPVGSRVWRLAVEADNVILNQWYVDFFGQISTPPFDRAGGIDPEFSVLALGYGVSPVTDRTDDDLSFEWSDAVAKLTVATGIVPITSLSVTALPLPIPSGATINLRTQVVTLSADASPGDTSITVTSFTPSLNYPIGEPVVYADVTIHVPQRLSLVIGTVDPTDPPSVAISYFLPAASNSEPITFTEAGLMYTSFSGLAFGSHVVFDYTKSGNTDTRVDYTLARESDE